MPSHPVGSLPTLALTIALSVCSWGLALPAAALAPAEQEQDSPVPMLSAQDLDELVGPIALYPDDLVALVLPASTFPLDIVQAARFMQKRVSNPQLEPSQTWDTSVLGLLNYPEIVTLMNDDLDWTQRLGTAVINQQRDVMDAIQDFRQRANAAGNLESDDKQVIVREKETIIIQPASPEVIYVPRYEPAQVVVYQSVPPYYYYPTPYPYWPLPFPIVRDNSRWRFDTAQGIEEMVNRRIGRNELHAIEVARAYLLAQREYAAADRDGDQVREYATRISSRPGMRDGLYWDAKDGEPVSPFGPLVADALADIPGHKAGGPYYGYYFKVLTRQGANPPGGAYDYVINGNMIAGFALVAFPADYGNSGIMTFLVSHQGRIVQKDLGEDTPIITDAMQQYDPDASWAALDE